LGAYQKTGQKRSGNGKALQIKILLCRAPEQNGALRRKGFISIVETQKNRHFWQDIELHGEVIGIFRICVKDTSKQPAPLPKRGDVSAESPGNELLRVFRK
jgi:hypothetical protein